MIRITSHLSIFCLCALLLCSCASEEPEGELGASTETTSETTEEPETSGDPYDDNRLTASEVTPEIQADMDKEEPADGEEVIVFDTSKGEIVVMLYGVVAPKTVDNFKKLVNEGFFDGTRFHRCIPGFMIQGGDPRSADLANSALWGSGGPGYTIQDELNPIKHEQGVLSMANTGPPNTGGSQFFIMDGVASHLNYKHAAFGRVLSGQDVAQAIIATGPTDRALNGKVEPDEAVVINSVKVVVWPLD